MLDAMIAYSDNPATDLGTRTVGADRARTLIAQLDLSAIRIPQLQTGVALDAISSIRHTPYALPAPGVERSIKDAIATKVVELFNDRSGGEKTAPARDA